MYSVSAFLVVCAVVVCVTGQGFVPGCGSGISIDDDAFQTLVGQIQQRPDGQTKEKYFAGTFLPTLHVGFTGNQTAQLMALWEVDDNTKVIAFNSMKPWVLGLTAADIVTILDTTQFDESKLTLLQTVVTLIYEPELESGASTIIAAFQYEESKNKAETLLQGVTPVSCLWGAITQIQNPYFVIDVSGSMADYFLVNGTKYTRIQYATQELAKTLPSMKSSQTFNIISFSDSVHKWKTSMVPATSANIQSAQAYVKTLKSGGGTSTYKMITTITSDDSCDGIYFLSDGQPTDKKPAQIIPAAKAWGKPINTILFDAGNKPFPNDPGTATFMEDLATATSGIFRNVNE